MDDGFLTEAFIARSRGLPRPVKNILKEGALSVNYFFYLTEKIFPVSGPRLFVNSIPKSGTNLMLEYLKLSGEFARRSYHVDSSSFLFDKTFGVRSGQFLTGHLSYSRALAEELSDRLCPTVFIYRDPRALIVSAAHYIIFQDKSHRLHRYGKTVGVRALCNDLIEGRSSVSGPEIDSLAEQLLRYQGWLDDEDVFSISYESIIAPSEENRVAIFRKFWTHVIGDEAVADKLAGATVIPASSRTMRSGKVNSWSDVLDSDMERRLIDRIGSDFGNWTTET